jgi:hypothetical protein
VVEVVFVELRAILDLEVIETIKSKDVKKIKDLKIYGF